MVFTALALFVLATAAPQDLELRNGNFHAGTAAKWEGPLVVHDGRVLPAGSKAPDGARVIDLHGAFVVPGLQDAHAHLLGLGSALESVDLTGTRSYDEVIARVRAAVATAKAGEWIIGRGWDQNLWRDKSMPHHADLSA
ncbi:MAG TPA: amidohydrolase family protein, partial [Planctomycetota bacterium]|nr:amidohydrolase family protein [Planctomycetota bacterium]